MERKKLVQSQIIYGKAGDKEAERLKKEILKTARKHRYTLSAYLITLHEKSLNRT